jgi:hypothetical protein
MATNQKTHGIADEPVHHEADPVNHELPVDTPEQVRDAWGYINDPHNMVKYDDYEAEMIKDRIRTAARELGVELHEA